MKRGLFVVFEGLESSGKTTLLKEVVNVLSYIDKRYTYIARKYFDPSFYFHRLTKEFLPIKDVTDSLQTCLRGILGFIQYYYYIKPALTEEKIVLCERYFDSILAYQGAKLLEAYPAEVRDSIQAITEVIQECKSLRVLLGWSEEPDIEFIIDCPVDLVLKRIKDPTQRDFLERVRAIYLFIARNFENRLVVNYEEDSSRLVNFITNYYYLVKRKI